MIRTASFEEVLLSIIDFFLKYQSIFKTFYNFTITITCVALILRDRQYKTF